MMKSIEVGGKRYEILEYGNLYGNISHVRSYLDLIGEVIHSGTDSGNNFYVVVRWLDDGGIEMFWEKDFEVVGFLPLKLLGPELTEEEVTEPDFISVRVVGVREYEDYSIVEMKVPSFLADYWFSIKDLEFIDEEEFK